MAYISVIVPVYNAENSIARCVNSICKQTFEDIEILLINDGSKDKSGLICDEIAKTDTRIHVIHQDNQGVSAARNRGLESAKGKYILYVDGDDYLPEDYCQSLATAQKEHGEDAFVWAALKIISENASVQEQKICYDTAIWCSCLARKDVLKLSAKYLLNSPVNKLYHAEIIKKNNLRMNPKISIAEDLLFNLEYLNAAGECSIVVLNDVNYYYVRNGQASLDYGYKRNYYTIHKKVLGTLWGYCQTWQVSKEDTELYYKRYWEYMQNAFSNLELADCTLGNLQKFVEKCRITADRHFQRSLVLQKENLGRGSYLVWRSRVYLLVWLYEKIRKRG